MADHDLPQAIGEALLPRSDIAVEDAVIRLQMAQRGKAAATRGGRR